MLACGAEMALDLPGTPQCPSQQSLAVMPQRPHSGMVGSISFSQLDRSPDQQDLCVGCRTVLMDGTKQLRALAAGLLDALQ